MGVMVPEFFLVAVVIFLFLLDFFLPGKMPRDWFFWPGLAGLISAAVYLVFLLPGEAVSLLEDTFYLDLPAKVFKVLLLFGSIPVLLLAKGGKGPGGLKEWSGEYYFLLLLAVSGGMIAISGGDLLTRFVGLETLNIASYILVSLKKKSILSNCRALTYLVNGGVATAFMLFGYSYLYGLGKTTNLRALASIPVEPGNREFFAIVILFLVACLAYKLTVSPSPCGSPMSMRGFPLRWPPSFQRFQS